MAKYSVHIETVGHSYIEVEANSEEEAMEIAQCSDEITALNCGELENIECTAIEANLVEKG